MIGDLTATHFNPLSAPDLVRVRQIYQDLRHERSEIFGGLPFSMSWIRIRYLKRGTIRTLASATFNPETLAIHAFAFEWADPILLKGLIHHELLHFVLGPYFGHGDLFRQIEIDWKDQIHYERQRQKFVHAIEEKADQEGRLYRYKCPSCSLMVLRTRQMKEGSACWDCCKADNEGIWSESYSFIRVGLSDTHMGEEAIPKMKLKEMTRSSILSAFQLNGCKTENKKSGAVKYTAISLPESDQRLAAIYGSRGGAAALWMKDGAWQLIKEDVDPDNVRVEDVDLFGRGFQWAIHFDHPDDPLIVKAVEASVAAGKDRWDRATKRRADDKRRAEARTERELKMAERRRDPFA